MQQLQKSQSIVALIDILGFKEIVKANNKTKDNAIFYKLQNAIEKMPRQRNLAYNML